MIIAIDIDGTLRDLETQIRQYIEMDYPGSLETYDKVVGKEYRTLTPTIGEEEAMKWLYDDRPFELFAIANRTHPKIIEDLNKFAKSAERDGHTVVIASVQRGKSIMATLSWLSKFGCKIKNYDFHDTMKDKIEAGYDVYVDDCPEVLDACSGQLFGTTDLAARNGPIGIKVPYKFNEDIDCITLDILGGKFNDIYEILNIERGF